MGRWAQRQRTGGGGSLALIIDAFATSSTIIDLTYNRPVTDSDFDLSNFETDNGLFPDSITNLVPARLRLTRAAFWAGVSTITYTGTVPSVLNPQTIAVGI